MLSGRYAEINSAEKRPAGSCDFWADDDGRTDGRIFFILVRQCTTQCPNGQDVNTMTTTICTNPNEDDDCGGYCIGCSCIDCKFHKVIEVDE